MKNNWKRNLNWILIIAVVVLVLTIPLFFKICNINIYSCFSPYIEKISDHNEFLGTYGDFVGGVLGTVLTLISVVYVAKTFREQQKETKTQRFNSLFFELLRVYQEQVKELCVCSEQVECNNKDFFDNKKDEIKDKLEHGDTIQDNKEKTLCLYVEFYIDNRSKIAAYFRTLFRILELIDKSELLKDDNKVMEGKQRKEYAKMLRAQFTESELFFIRYNALSPYGQDIIEYLNKYRILKHLPFCDLLEYKNIWSSCSLGNDNDSEKVIREKREGLNIIFYEICETCKEVFKMAEKKPRKEYLKEVERISCKKYRVFIGLKNINDFYIRFEIDNGEVQAYRPYICMKGKNKEFKVCIFDAFICEIFNYSTFGKFNSYGDIELYNNFDDGDENIIISGLRSSGKPLKLRYINN